MPPLKQIYRIHPQTSEVGIWFDLTIMPGFVGMAEAAWPAVPTTGSRESRRATLEADLNAALQALCETRRSFTDMEKESTADGTRLDEDPITRDLIAEPFCRYETATRVPTTTRGDIQDYVVRVVEIQVEVRSTNPIVIGNITVSNAASGVVRV